MTREPEPEEPSPPGDETPAPDPSPELAGAPRQRAYVPMSMAAFPTELLDKAKKKKGGGAKPVAGAPSVAPAPEPEPGPASDELTTEDAPIVAPVVIEIPAVVATPKPSTPPNYAMIAAAFGLLLVVFGSLMGIVVIVGAAVAWWALGG